MTNYKKRWKLLFMISENMTSSLNEIKNIFVTDLSLWAVKCEVPCSMVMKSTAVTEYLQ